MAPIQLPWKATRNGLPEKPGKQNYEHVPCLVILDQGFRILCWNCEHGCWDDEDGDDYMCDATEVDYYVPLIELSKPQP